MQKRAFQKSLQAVYTPISFCEGALSYIDPYDVPLPATPIDHLHSHDCIEVGVCLSGSGLFLLGDRVESVQAGDGFYIPPMTPHYSQAISREPCVCAFVYLRPDVLQNTVCIAGVQAKALLSRRGAPQIFRTETASALSELLFRLIRDTRAQNLPLIALHTWELLLSMPDTRVQNCTYGTDPVSAAAEYMAVRYKEKNDAQTLAAVCHLSESQLRRRFRAVFGETPYAYLHRLRCRIAAEMLQSTARTVEDIADAVGYACASDLFRHFKKIFGASPVAWRRTRNE